MLLTEALKVLAIDGGKEHFLEAVDRLHSTYKSKAEWKKLFVDTGKFFIDHENNAEKVFDDLALVLSRTNMEAVAKEFENESGYELKERLLHALISLMNKYDIPHDVAYSYSYRILSVIICEMQRVYPEKYDQHYQAEWRKEEHEALIEIKEQIEKVRNDIERFEKKNLGIHSADEMELKLRRSSDNIRIGIDFFEIDDDTFKEQFSEKKNDNVICIKAKCKEEAILCIIHELWMQGDHRAIFVVDNKESWEQLSNIYVSDSIFIPRFYDEEIIPISSNTTIFIFTEGYPSFFDDEIELRPRTQNTLLRLLQRAGMSYEDAFSVIRETHGLYVPMKKKLFHNAFLQLPEWNTKLEGRVKQTALLLGQWTDSEGDQLIIEELSGVRYGEFMSRLIPYSSGEDPFIHIVKRSPNKIYMLASAEIAWEYIDCNSDSAIWKKFLQLFLYVINESEKLYTYSHEERIAAQIRGEKLFFSPSLREGMVRSILLKAFYKCDEECQKELDEIAQTVMKHIDSEEKWRYFANFFESFCEISPSVVINRVNDEFAKPTGLMELFEHQTEDFLFERNPYINIMWGVEQFLSQEMFVSDAFKWFLKLHDRSYNYISNTPKDTIIKVLCTWYNFSCISDSKDKVFAANTAFETDNNAWDLVYESLPYNHRSIVGKLTYPKYRPHAYESQVTNIELFKTIDEYVTILVEHIDGDSCRWNKLLDIADELSDKNRELVIEKLTEAASTMPDDDKLAIYNHIRSVVYKHRFYSSAAWATKESILDEYVALLDRFEFNAPEYSYAYLFRPSDSGIILDPEPFDKNGREENSEKINNAIIAKIAEFKKSGLSLSKLCLICGKEERSTLGVYLADNWDRGFFHSKVFKMLYHSQPSRQMALDYCRKLSLSDQELFKKTMELDSEIKYDTDFLVELYRIQATNSSASIPEISNADELLKKTFWRQAFIPRSELSTWALEECSKYGTLESYVETLFFINYREHLSASDLLKHLRVVNNMKSGPLDSSFGYHIKELLKLLQNEYISDSSIRTEIARFELRFYDFLDWNDMRCFQIEMKKSPVMYAEIAYMLFKCDDDSKKPELDKEYAKNIYALFSKAKFCPGEENGVVDKELLSNWLLEFKNLLAKQKQMNLYGFLVGRLFAHSPAGSDGYYPCEPVRDVIETINSDDLISSYRTELFNERGVFSPSAGKEEQQIASRYKENADFLAIKYPRTASVFFGLYKTYIAEAKLERENAENGQF